MFEITTTDFGLEIDLEGRIDAAEAKEFHEALETETQKQPDGFHIYADHRGIETMPDDAEEAFADLMSMCKDHGLDRSVVVFDSTINKLQHRRLKESADIDGQTLIDASTTDDWRSDAREWIEQ